MCKLDSNRLLDLIINIKKSLELLDHVRENSKCYKCDFSIPGNLCPPSTQSTPWVSPWGESSSSGSPWGATTPWGSLWNCWRSPSHWGPFPTKPSSKIDLFYHSIGITSGQSCFCYYYHYFLAPPPPSCDEKISHNSLMHDDVFTEKKISTIHENYQPKIHQIISPCGGDCSGAENGSARDLSSGTPLHWLIQTTSIHGHSISWIDG